MEVPSKARSAWSKNSRFHFDIWLGWISNRVARSARLWRSLSASIATVALNVTLNFRRVRFYWFFICSLKYTNLTNGPIFGEYYIFIEYHITIIICLRVIPLKIVMQNSYPNNCAYSKIRNDDG